MDRYFQLKRSKEQLTKAKDIIRDYKIVVEGDHTTVCSVPEENRCINVLKLNEQAEQFLKECVRMTENNKHSVWKNKKTGNFYVVIYNEAIECTNGREDIDYTVYTSINDVKDMNAKYL